VILLLGDSITQMGSNEYDGATGWVAKMQAHYNRKVSSSKFLVTGGADPHWLSSSGSNLCAGCVSCMCVCQEQLVHMCDTLT
jgi:hypothetical protein